MLTTGQSYTTSARDGAKRIEGTLRIRKIEGGIVYAEARTVEYHPNRPEKKTPTFYPQFPIDPDRVNAAGAIRILGYNWQPDEDPANNKGA